MSAAPPAQAPDLGALSRAQLHSLLSSPNDDAFLAWARELPALQQLAADEAALRAEAESKAAQNLALAPPLEALRQETTALYERARRLEAEWAAGEARQREAYKRFAPSSLHASLAQSVAQLHDESERMASAYVEGLPLGMASDSSPGAATPAAGTPPNGTATPPQLAAADDFVRRYRALRGTYHRRNILLERWARGSVTWRDE